MAKKYKIKVNGNEYDVEVEEIREVNTDVSSETIVKPKVETSKIIQKESKKSSNVPSGASTINAPMPGTVLRVDVNEGDMVKSGQVIMILEAMKMENEIIASKDGKIASLNVVKGDSVNAGEVLFSID